MNTQFDRKNHDDLYLFDKMRHTKTPFPESTLALCLIPFGMYTVTGDETL